MERITETMTERAADFIWLTGSVLDQHRMELFTGDGSREAALTALNAYRTDQGVYAYALEPDVKGPAPQPITQMTALEILDELGALDQRTATPICDWLAEVSAPDGGAPNLLASIGRYPKAPFVEVPTETVGGLLATARTVGLLLKNGIEHPWIEGARAFCRKEIDAIETTFPYEVFSVNVFLDNEPDRAWARAASERLGRIVRESDLVLLDPANPEGIKTPPGFAPEEYHYPADFAPAPDRLAAEWFSPEEMALSLDHLASEQREDGGWPMYYVRWSPATELQARPGFTLLALRTLRAWDKAA